MKTTLKTATQLGAAGLLTGMLVLAGCASDSTRNMGQKLSDREVAGSVKKQLDRDPTYKYNDVTVNVYDGSVQLSGFVQTPQQRQQAADLAARAAGATQVINNIMLRPMPTGPATIRDEYGKETGHVMLDTNAPPPQERTPSEETAPAK